MPGNWMQWLLGVVIILALVIVLLALCAPWFNGKNDKGRRGRHGSTGPAGPGGDPVYGEWVLSTGAGPIAAGDAIPFPTPVVPPVGGAVYVNDGVTVGVIVPAGTYSVLWEATVVDGGTLNLQVNSVDPTTPTSSGYAYAESVVATGGTVRNEYLVAAPLEQGNVISLANAGGAPFDLDVIPYTTETRAHIRIQRVGA